MTTVTEEQTVPAPPETVSRETPTEVDLLADWRYQQLLEQLKTMTKALPAAQDAAPRPNRWWWPFR